MSERDSAKSGDAKLLLVNSAEQPFQMQSSSDLVMAWAIDCETNQPRYILQLDTTHRGAKCNCKCPSCNLPLTAVNAAKVKWEKRPHFRHPEGAARERCVIVAARKALEEIFTKQQRIVLPRRRRPNQVEGLSGKFFNAWVERPAESVGISNCSFNDEANAILTLDDGRRLLVQLVGRGEIAKHEGDDQLMARIEINVDDPAIATMPPEEIFSRLELAWTHACWTRHWADGEMDREAEDKARSDAVNALDWMDDDDLGDLPAELSPAERRETLLHREVKEILKRERRIRLPGLPVEVSWRRGNGFVDTRKWFMPEAEVALTSVELEVHLGHSVPDVVADWIDADGWTHTMLIEVTVTNMITDERIERLSSLGLPVLEIDISRMGGTVTREELTRLVVKEVAGKRWLHHPSIAEEKSHLVTVMKREEAKDVAEAQARQAVIDVPATIWAESYLDAFKRRWLEQSKIDGAIPDNGPWKTAQSDIYEAINALVVHGYPASYLDEYPLRTVIARILSIREETGIEYKCNDTWGVINAIRCDRGAARHWHTFYLIAVRAYQPGFIGEHQKKVDEWRDEVFASIEHGESAYVRETTYDRLIGVLFPELQPALSYQFGTHLYIPKPVVEQLPVSLPADNIDATLLRASGVAVSKGMSPISFAQEYARQSGQLSVEQIICRLIDQGVAKNKGSWS